MNSEKLSIADFQHVCVIGKGSFAKVHLVRKKATGELHAMKVLKKKFIIKRGMEKYVTIENNILKMVNHPFVVKLNFAFQNDKKLYFIMDYCAGGQFYRILEKGIKLSPQVIKLYAAQIVLAIQYLHDLDIVYRDLKPENILIGKDGYLKIADFGLSKMNVIGKDAVSVCGTPQYMSPQILNKIPYGKEVDWWCLGILLYEMYVGVPPFYNMDKNILVSNIKNKKPSFSTIKDKVTVDFIKSLLIKNPDQRLGSKGSQEVKGHPWFEGISWNDVLNKKIKPEIIPDLKDETDVSNFSQDFTNMEIQSNEASVQSDEQKVFSDFSYDENDKMEAEESESFEIKIVEE